MDLLLPSSHEAGSTTTTNNNPKRGGGGVTPSRRRTRQRAKGGGRHDSGIAAAAVPGTTTTTATAAASSSLSPSSMSSMSSTGSPRHIIRTANGGNAAAGSAAAAAAGHEITRRLVYASILFGLCYVQISANFFVYHFGGIHHQQLQQQQQPLPSVMPDTTSHPEEEDADAVPLLQTALSDLQRRLEGFQAVLAAAEVAESSGGGSANAAVAEDFFPFTIRDSRRTVPTQVPHGFHIFDRVDLRDPNDSNHDHDTAAASGTASLYYDGLPLTFPSGSDNNDYGCPRDKDDDDYSLRCYRATILHVLDYLLHTTRAEYYFYMEADNDLCTTLEEVHTLAMMHRRYFISTGVGFSGWIMSRQFVQDFYDVYRREDDHHNPGLSDGTGTSSRGAGGTGDSLPPGGVVRQQQQSDAHLRPDLVGWEMLHEKRAWSVTRRYLTSHSILAATGAAAGLTELFVIEDDDADAANVSAVTVTAAAAGATTNATAVVTADTGAANVSAFTAGAAAAAFADEEDHNSDNSDNHTAPVYVPTMHLPRCLEPHRGIWPAVPAAAATTTSTGLSNSTSPSSDTPDGDTISRQDRQHDMFRWGYFVYDWCPDSPIFPCKEGQLDALWRSGNDTVLHNRFSPDAAAAAGRTKDTQQPPFPVGMDTPSTKPQQQQHQLRGGTAKIN